MVIQKFIGKGLKERGEYQIKKFITRQFIVSCIEQFSCLRNSREDIFSLNVVISYISFIYSGMQQKQSTVVTPNYENRLWKEGADEEGSLILISYIKIYDQQMMLNFNNKTSQGADSIGQHQLDFSINARRCQFDNEKKQGNATRCLLYLSQSQQGDKTYNLEDIQVTPWINIKQNNGEGKLVEKSKTSIILHRNDCENKFNGQQQRGWNYHSKEQKMGDKNNRKPISLRKKISTIKNSYSSIATYHAIPNEHTHLPMRQYSQTKKQAYIQIIHNNEWMGRQSNDNKIDEQNEKKQADNSRINKQNQIIEVISCQLPKFEQNSCSMTLQNNYKIHLHGNAVLTSPILKTNSAIINGVNDMTDINQHINQIQFIRDRRVKEFHLDDEEMVNNKYSTTKQLFSPQKQQYYLSKIHNRNGGEQKASEYQRIKKKIMENIQKQTIISANIMGSSSGSENRNSKKILGRYFKQTSLSKRSKGRFRESSMRNNWNKTQISNYSYECSNPLTKHLYEKYRLLIRKGK